jgi:hypothetical protein
MTQLSARRRWFSNWFERFQASRRSWWDNWIERRKALVAEEPVVEEPVVEEPVVVDDTFDFTFKKSENRRGRDIITTEFTVTDSITGNDYKGGDEIYLEISGHWENSRGRFRYMSYQTTIDDFGPVEGSKEYAVGNSRIATIFNNAEEVTVSLSTGLGTNSDVFFTEVFDVNDVIDPLA